ncbi:unnamed protein product [Alopecurus aequalis]
MSVAAGVHDAAIAVRDEIVRTKVKRYWSGRSPVWAGETADDDFDLRRTIRAGLDKAFPRHEGADVPAVKDDRLLTEIHALTAEELPAGSRHIQQAEIVSTAEEEDEEAQDERRQRIRERCLLRERDEQKEMLPQEDEELAEDEDEGGSEYDTGSEDEGMAMEIVKPVFLPKPLRDTNAERERIEEKERHLKELANKKMEDGKVETRMIVVEEIRKEEQIEKTRNGEADIEIANVDPDDEVNEAEEYEAWRCREIARIKRGREQIEGRLRGKHEIEKVRHPNLKKKWKFMQKYYHKGAFFQDEADDVAQTAGSDDIYMRDYSAATGEDKMDKSILPKVMQVKKFGLSGRVKWTGLVNEDTTALD